MITVLKMDHLHPLQVQIMEPKSNFDKILNNFDQFCDEFENQAASSYSKLNNGDIERTKRDDKETLQEIRFSGEENVISGTTPIDVQATYLSETRESSGDT